MQIPLVDVHAAVRASDPTARSALPRGPRQRPVHPRPALLGVPGGGGRVPRRRALGRRGNGTDALVLALDALEVGPGDEVICPAFTFYATAESIARRGATPVFAEIDPVTLNLDPEDVAREGHRSRTRAIMPVHLFGRPAPLEEIVELGLPVIEDAAQAFGAPGVAELGTRLHLQLLPDEEPLLPRRRRPRRDERRRARRARADALLPRLARQDRLRLRRLQLAPRRAAGRDAAHLPAPARRLEPPAAARPRRATRSSASATSSSSPSTSRATSTTCSCAARPERDRIRAALTEAGDRLGRLLHDPAPPAAGAPPPRLPAGLAAGDRAGRDRQLLGAALAGDPGRGAGARRGRRPLRSRRRRRSLDRCPCCGTGSGSCWWTRRSSRCRGGSPSSCASTRGCPSTTRTSCARRSCS